MGRTQNYFSSLSKVDKVANHNNINSRQTMGLLRRSLPKTEKKQSVNSSISYKTENTYSSMLPGGRNEGYGYSYNGYEASRGGLNKTLSDIRKMKNSPDKVQKKSQNTIRFNGAIVPFVPKYFQPVNLEMEALRLESLKLPSAHPPLFAPFYQNEDISLTLVKNPHFFTLKVKNISPDSLQIGTGMYLQEKYGDKFSKMISFEQISSENVTLLNSGASVPVDFSFYTGDPNFKFLGMVLSINGAIKNFYLPITLLDMCQKGPRNLGNRMIRSEQFYCDAEALSLFSANIGNGANLSINGNGNGYVCDLQVTIKQGRSNGRCTVCISFDERWPSNIAYAKVIL